MSYIIGGPFNATAYLRGMTFDYFFNQAMGIANGWTPPGLLWLALHTQAPTGDGSVPAEVFPPPLYPQTGYRRIPLVMLDSDDTTPNAPLGVICFNEGAVFPRALLPWNGIANYGLWDGDGLDPLMPDNLWFFSALFNSPQTGTLGVLGANTPATAFNVPPGRKLRVPRRTIEILFQIAQTGAGGSAGWDLPLAQTVYRWWFQGGERALPSGPSFMVHLYNEQLVECSASGYAPQPCTIQGGGGQGTNDATILFPVATADWGDCGLFKLADISGGTGNAFWGQNNLANFFVKVGAQVQYYYYPLLPGPPAQGGYGDLVVGVLGR